MPHFSSYFSRPTTVRETSDNIREAKASQRRLRDRGDFAAADALDDEIRHQQNERRRIVDERNCDLDEIWGA